MDAASTPIPMVIANRWPPNANSANPGLDLTLRQITVPHHSATLPIGHKISMGSNESLHFRLHCIG